MVISRDCLIEHGHHNLPDLLILKNNSFAIEKLYLNVTNHNYKNSPKNNRFL